MRLFFLLFTVVFSQTLTAQDQKLSQGSFCLEYFPQPIVETYVDSLVSHLSREFQSDETALDSTMKAYIEDFASAVTRRSKCVYFSADSILIQEKVDDRLASSYLIIPEANILISRDRNGLQQEPYFIESSDTSGYFDYLIKLDESDTKVIAGLPCYKVELTELYYQIGTEEPFEKRYDLYVTDAIPIPAAYVLGINMRRNIGCPLEIQEPLNSKVNISYRANNLSLRIPEEVFSSF